MPKSTVDGTRSVPPGPKAVWWSAVALACGLASCLARPIGVSQPVGSCGDGVVDPGEQCDDGPENSDSLPGACRSDCSLPSCGDGVVDPGEQCDDGARNGSRGSDCTETCSLAGSCGDGMVQPPEECDDGTPGDRYDGCLECRVSEFLANEYEQGVQGWPAADLDAAGRLVIVWHSYEQDGSGYGISGRCYAPDGTPATHEFQVNQYEPNNQVWPRVAALDNGTFVVVWQSKEQDGSGYGIYGRVFDWLGQPVSDEFLVNGEIFTSQQRPRVAPCGRGGFVVVWQSNGQDGDGKAIFGRVFDGPGLARTPEFQVNEHVAGDQQLPAVACRTAGPFLAVWQSSGVDGQGTGIAARLFDQQGAALGPEFVVNELTQGDQTQPAVALLPDGRYAVAWASHVGGESFIGLRFLNQDGSAAGPEIGVTQPVDLDRDWAGVASAGDHVLVIWHGEATRDNYDVFVQAVGLDGTLLGPATRANTYLPDNQVYPWVAAGSDGRAVVVWRSNEQDADMGGVLALLLRPDGTPVPPGEW